MATDTTTTPLLQSPLILTTLILTLLVALAGGIYMSGAADDLVTMIMERYLKAEAKAEEKVLEKSGAGMAEGFLKSRLKQNPLVSNSELNEVSSGLGDEAEREGVVGNLGSSIGKAFD